MNVYKFSDEMVKKLRDYLYSNDESLNERFGERYLYDFYNSRISNELANKMKELESNIKNNEFTNSIITNKEFYMINKIIGYENNIIEISIFSFKESGKMSESFKIEVKNDNWYNISEEVRKLHKEHSTELDWLIGHDDRLDDMYPMILKK